MLVIVPHPDDETLGCGQALHCAAAAGHALSIVLLTDGEGSHPASPSHPPEKLKTLRRSEFAKALHALTGDRPPAVTRLSLPDGATSAASLDDTHLERSIAAARAIDARAVWTTWDEDPHCDHQAAAALARHTAEACDAQLWLFPVWGRFANSATAPGLHIFDRPGARLAKRRAAAAHRSQFTDLIDDDPDAFRMPAELLDHFLGHPELFIRG